jgi:low affinity Fe/Cu permease
MASPFRTGPKMRCVVRRGTAEGAASAGTQAAPGVADRMKELSMDHLFTRIAAKLSTAVGQPLAFILALAGIILWAVTGPIFAYSDTWQLIVNTSTTIVTFLMVFLIQNAQNRDAAAMQAKLDELIRAVAKARNGYIGIEHLTEKELEKIRSEIEEECTSPAGNKPHHSDSIAHLIRRR